MPSCSGATVTNLLGRRARGSYPVTYDDARGKWSWADVEGEIVAVFGYKRDVGEIWILGDVTGVVHRCSVGNVVILPRDYVGALR